MAWEAAYPIVDAVLGAGSAAVEYGPRAAIIGGVTYAAAKPKRAREYLNTIENAGSTAIRDITHPWGWYVRERDRKRQRVVPDTPGVEKAKAGKMTLLTYRR